MRVLFDENVPAPLRQALAHHEVKTLQEQGWRGISNGDLVSLADGRFEVLVLADKNLRYQQNLGGRRLALVELPTNRWPLLQPILARIRATVDQAMPGSYTVIEPVEPEGG
jgi:hypothetical protein